ncbi:hypothetical protein DF039_04075 [Burkholderia cenocepacia]|nr:hypothetical protein DF039_04075 [Burkholderia cenocepacia]
MQRINSPDGHFHAGDPSAGIKGTVVTRDFMETVQEELAAIPESVGWKLDKGDNKQILKAIQKMFADSGKVLQESVDKHHKTLVDAKVNRAGDTISGELVLKSDAGDYSPHFALSSPRYTAYLQAGADEGGIVLILDKTGKIRNFVVRDNGTAWLRDALDAAHVNSRGDATVSGRLHLRRDGDVGELVLISKEGKNAFLRGRHDGGMEWVNHAYGAVVASMDDLGWFRATRIESGGDIHAQRTVYAGGGISACEAVIRSTDGTLMRLRGRDKGGGMFWVNNANKDVVATMDDAGNFYAGYVESRGDVRATNALYSGAAVLAKDGNIKGSIWGGGWLADWLNAKLDARDSGKVNKAGDEMTGDLTVPSLMSRGAVRVGSSCYVGDATYQSDGNIKGGAWGGNWLSNWLNGQFSARDNNINSRATYDWVNQNFAIRDHNRQVELEKKVSCDPRWQFMIGWDPNAQHVNLAVNGTVVAFVQVNVSDRRRKEDIHLATDVDSLAKIDRAKFYRYKWKNGDGREVFGPIAQQLRSIEPRWTYQVPDADPLEQPLMLDTLNMQIDAMRAIQQLSGKVRELEKQMTALMKK